MMQALNADRVPRREVRLFDFFLPRCLTSVSSKSVSLSNMSLSFFIVECSIGTSMIYPRAGVAAIFESSQNFGFNIDV
jgi:hypothetical protein